MADDIKKTIEEARDYDTLDRMTPGELFGLAGKLADALEESEAMREMLRRNALIVLDESDALRTAIQPVLDAWNTPGIRPDYHDSMMFALHHSWPTLYSALTNLSRTIDTKEPELDDMTKADMEQEERDHIFDTEGY